MLPCHLHTIYLTVKVKVYCLLLVKINLGLLTFIELRKFDKLIEVKEE